MPLDRLLATVAALKSFRVAALTLTLVLTQPVGEAVEVDVGTAPVPALETRANGILTCSDIIKERRRSRGNIGLRLPGDLEGVVITAALRIFDGYHGRVVVHAAGFLCESQSAAARRLTDLKTPDGIEGDRLAATAAFVPALGALHCANKNRVSAHAHFGA